MRLKVQNKGIKLLTLVDAVVYVEFFLTREPLK